MDNLHKQIKKLKRQITVDKVATAVFGIGALAGAAVSTTQVMAGNELGAVGWGTLALTNAANVVKTLRDFCDAKDNIRELTETETCPDVVPMVEVVDPHNSYVKSMWDTAGTIADLPDTNEIEFTL